MSLSNSWRQAVIQLRSPAGLELELEKEGVLLGFYWWFLTTGWWVDVCDVVAEEHPGWLQLPDLYFSMMSTYSIDKCCSCISY